jgi:hypothetical protein
MILMDGMVYIVLCKAKAIIWKFSESEIKKSMLDIFPVSLISETQ